MAYTESNEARERARAAMARVGKSLAAGEPPRAEADRELGELAARLDAQLWERHGAGTSSR